MEQEILDLLQRAQDGHPEARDELLRRHRTFIHEAVCLLSRRTLDWADDELSVGLMAFNEAIDRFEEGRGASFLPFARTLIRSRLVDHWRREAGHRATTSLDGYDAGHHPAEVQEADRQFAENFEVWERTTEIELLEEYLHDYGIDLVSLEKASPSHRRKRRVLRDAAVQLAEDRELRERLLRMKKLPIKELMVKTGLSRKVLEGSRRYLIALVVMMTGEPFHHLRSFAGLPHITGRDD